MNLYLISQTVNDNWDTYDSAVVAAESEKAARATHPSGDNEDWKDERGGGFGDLWCGKEDVSVKYLGVAADGIPAGVVCASFNAG